MYKYICLNCFHEWNALNNKDVLRCSNCHRNQGVDYNKFRQTVDLTKTALRKITASPPPHPPPLDVIGLIPEALGPILEVAGKEFPNPNMPLNFFREIIRLAHDELKEESSAESSKG